MKIINRVQGFILYQVRPGRYLLVSLFDFGLMFRNCFSLAEAEYAQSMGEEIRQRFLDAPLMTAARINQMTKDEGILKDDNGLDFRCLYDNIKNGKGERHEAGKDKV